MSRYPTACEDEDPTCIGFGTVYQVTTEEAEEEGGEVDLVPLRMLYGRVGFLSGLLAGMVVWELWTTLKGALL